MSKKPVLLTPCLIAVLLLALPVATFAAPTQPLADVENRETKLIFYPNAAFDELVLTIQGPCDFQQRQVITDGEFVFYLDATTIDGTYTYYLVRHDAVDPDIVKVLQQARQEDDPEVARALCRAGKLPGPPVSQSENFQVVRGSILYDPFTVEEGGGGKVHSSPVGGERVLSSPLGGGPAVGGPIARGGDIVHNNDVIIDGSLCVGFDCVCGESFGFDTIRLKEHNLRIKFDDTSTAASFPQNDWQITANDSANGGAAKFSIEDITGGRTVTTIEAGARSHSLYIDDGGRIGSRTSTPSVEIHTVDGDTPTLRLQQDGSSGFAPQTWDVAGNETNFFVRDVTNGSTLPFRIRPGAPTSAIDIDDDGNVGVGDASPDASLNVERSDGTAQILVEETNGSSALRSLLQLSNNGPAAFVIENTSGGTSPAWEFVGGAGGGANLRIGDTVDANNEFILDGAGNLTITGEITTSGSCSIGCDRVFTPEYELESIAEHAAYMWENNHLKGVGPTLEGAPMNVSLKTEGLLNELEKAHIYIDQLSGTVGQLNGLVRELQERLEALEGSQD